MLDGLKQDETKQATPPHRTLNVDLHTYQKTSCTMAWMLDCERGRTGPQGGSACKSVAEPLYDISMNRLSASCELSELLMHNSRSRTHLQCSSAALSDILSGRPSSYCVIPAQIV